MFKIDNKDIKKLESKLDFIAKRAIPHATKNTLNSAAFSAMNMARADVKRNMINRNQFTAKSILFNKTSSTKISTQKSSVGSIADYMETQEFGGTEKKKGSEGVAIPTSFSAGLSDNAKPRTRLPRGKNAIKKITLRNKKRRAANRKQALVFKVQDSVTSGKRYFFHDLGGGKKKGIFKVVGGRKSFKRGWPKGARLKMVYDLSEQTVDIPKNPWLKPAFDESVRMIPAFYADALRYQLRRIK